MQKTLTALSAAAILALAAAAWAEPDRGHGREFKQGHGPGGDPARMLMRAVEDSEMATKAGITDEEVTKIKDALYEGRKKVIELKADEDLAQLELQRLLDSETAASEEVLKAVENAGRIRTDLHKARVQQMLGVRDILGPEKAKKVRELVRSEYRERKHLRGAAPGEGRGDRLGKGPGEGRGEFRRGEGRHHEGEDDDGPPWMRDEMPPPEAE